MKKNIRVGIILPPLVLNVARKNTKMGALRPHLPLLVTTLAKNKIGGHCAPLFLLF